MVIRIRKHVRPVPGPSSAAWAAMAAWLLAACAPAANYGTAKTVRRGHVQVAGQYTDSRLFNFGSFLPDTVVGIGPTHGASATYGVTSATRYSSARRSASARSA